MACRLQKKSYSEPEMAKERHIGRCDSYNKSDERRQTLGHLGSIYLNMINRFANQSPLFFIYAVCTRSNKDFVLSLRSTLKELLKRCHLLIGRWYTWFCRLPILPIDIYRKISIIETYPVDNMIFSGLLNILNS